MRISSLTFFSSRAGVEKTQSDIRVVPQASSNRDLGGARQNRHYPKTPDA